MKIDISIFYFHIIYIIHLLFYSFLVLCLFVNFIISYNCTTLKSFIFYSCYIFILISQDFADWLFNIFIYFRKNSTDSWRDINTKIVGGKIY